MKKFTLLPVILILMVFNINVFSQILNAGFENWTDTEPDNWSTSNVPGLYVTTTQSSDAHGGSFSARLEIVNYFNTPYPGHLISIDTSGEIGHPISSKYTLLKGYYKSDIKGTGILDINILMIDDGSNYIGAGNISITVSNSNWTQFNVPIEYYSDQTPSFCHIQFVLGDSTGSSDLSSVGSYVLLDDLTLDEVTSVQANENLPVNFSLCQNYPNPFNPSTVINFSNPEISNIKIEIYNAIGQEVNTLINKEFAPGYHELKWNAENLPSGIYFIKINAKSNLSHKEFSDVKKAILMK